MGHKAEILPLTLAFGRDAADLYRQCIHKNADEQKLVSGFFEEANHYFQAVEDGVLLGFGGYSAAVDQGDVLEIAVAPAARRRGIARSILLALIGDARCRGVRQLFLEVRASNEPAILLYTSFGFVRTGVRKNYYSAPREDAVLFCLDLSEDAEQNG